MKAATNPDYKRHHVDRLKCLQLQGLPPRTLSTKLFSLWPWTFGPRASPTSRWPHCPCRRHADQWMVGCKALGAGMQTSACLGRHLYRGGICEKGILACKNGQAIFHYQDSKTRQMKTCTLPGADFRWLLLRHVLRRCFHRSRNFGLLHPNCKRCIDHLTKRTAHSGHKLKVAHLFARRNGKNFALPAHD